MKTRFQSTDLVLIRYCASATDSVAPVMVIVRSVLLSRSSQLEIRIIAPLICLQRANERDRKGDTKGEGREREREREREKRKKQIIRIGNLIQSKSSKNNSCPHGADICLA